MSAAPAAVCLIGYTAGLACLVAGAGIAGGHLLVALLPLFGDRPAFYDTFVPVLDRAPWALPAWRLACWARDRRIAPPASFAGTLRTATLALLAGIVLLQAAHAFAAALPRGWLSGTPLAILMTGLGASLLATMLAVELLDVRARLGAVLRPAARPHR